MAITTFLTLKQAIGNWLGRDDLDARIPEFISMAEDRIARNLRVQAMETSADLSITSGSDTVAQPTGYLETIRLYLDDDRKRLTYMTPSVFWTRNAANESGTPEIFTIEDQNFVFKPQPASNFTGKLLYYKSFDALSGNADTNWLLTNARGLLLYGALLEAYLYLEDDAGAAKYGLMFDNALADLKKEDRMARYPRGGNSARSQVHIV